MSAEKSLENHFAALNAGPSTLNFFKRMRWLKKVALWGAILLLVTSCLGYLFENDFKRSLKRFIEYQTAQSIVHYGSGLPPIDEVRLLHIEESPASPGLGTYRIPFHDTAEMTIVADKTLSGEEAQEIVRQWKALRLHTQYMAGCYAPHHVVQFRARGAIVCEAVICFDCGNTTIPGLPVKVLVSFESMQGNESADYLRFKSMIEETIGRHEDPRMLLEAVER